jgi:LPS sulfotransferase NodH
VSIVIKVAPSSLAKIRNAMPAEDFVDAAFDQPGTTPVTDVLIVLSTPRCGSTLFADLVYRSGVCLPHEYFQPHQYLPLLADRWGCIDNGRINLVAYMNQLLAHRTFPGGWLGINLHGSHLKVFAPFADVLPAVRTRYVHISRRDIIAQAVSYEIAHQTGQWSSRFPSPAKAAYDFEAVRRRLRSIQEQEVKIQSYLLGLGVDCSRFFYEELVSEPRRVLGAVLPESAAPVSLQDSGMNPQSGKQNREWAKRFAEDYFSRTDFE